MSRNDALITLLEELKGLSTSLLALSFDDENELERLQLIQTRQSEIRELMEQGGYSKVELAEPRVQVLFKECYELEMKCNNLLSNVREDTSREISKFKTSARLRNGYQNVYSQAEGYFIDNKK